MITTLRITGMSCNGCVKHVGDALRKVPGVSAVEVDLAGGQAKVVHDPQTSPADSLIAAVAGAGYEAAV